MKRAQDADVLVIGAGLAGSIAALNAVKQGRKVTLVHRADSASQWAQGGIVYKGAEDPGSLVDDILQAGAGLNNRAAVELIAREGPAAVDRWLREAMSVPFDAGLDGNPDLTLEAAHNARRILHVKDYSGRAISECVARAVDASPNIERVDGVLVDIILADRHDRRPEAEYRRSRASGAYVFLPGTRDVVAVKARATVLATGGYSSLYQHSTGPTTSRGDGIAAAHRAGARTLHLEFVQFHPTALYIPGEPRKLLTEALRGAGARLLNFKNERFVDELAPRDVVARAIHEELISSGAAHVWLDLTTIPDLETKYPSIVKLLAEKGIDPRKAHVPVVPAAHYTIGGVWTDLDGATSVPGLYAAGEVAATGLHGANRLASTSLLEALVFGERAGRAAAEDAVRAEAEGTVTEPRSWEPARTTVDPALLAQDGQFLRQTLWNYVGLVRSERRLQRAERILGELRNEVEWFYKRAELSEELIALRNGTLVAELLLYAALRRRKSVGTHYLKEGY